MKLNARVVSMEEVPLVSSPTNMGTRVKLRFCSLQQGDDTSRCATKELVIDVDPNKQLNIGDRFVIEIPDLNVS